MTKEIAILIACFVAIAGLCAVSFHAGADYQKSDDAKAAAKQAQRQNEADAAAAADAQSFSTDIDKGLVTDARKTDTAVTGAKSRLHALKPPVVTPAPQCGPSAYVIQVEGATPDDVWAAYVDGRNSVFQAADSSQASSVHSVNSDAVMPASTAQSE